MPKLKWGASGSRVYETGVDRGVLYVPGQDGVSWSGLISVTEQPSGGDPRPFYIDGVKFLNIPAAEEFQATINAFTYPDLFGICDGTATVRPGLFVTQQRRQPFSFSYRTRVANELVGTDYAYKIHLVYNALATPAERENKTLDESADPINFAWNVTTTPPAMAGFRRSAHIVIDTRYVNAGTVATVEGILYGTDIAHPRIPMLDELATIFDTNAGVIIIDNGDGTWTAEGSDDLVSLLDSETIQIISTGVTILDADSYTISSS